jgi:hypothetical protein
MVEFCLLSCTDFILCVFVRVKFVHEEILEGLRFTRNNSEFLSLLESSSTVNLLKDTKSRLKYLVDHSLFLFYFD